MTLRLGLLGSGRGSNIRAIIRNCKTGKLKAIPAVVLSNNAASQVLKYAHGLGIPAIHCDHPQSSAQDREMTAILQQHQVELVVLAGYLRKIGPQLLKVWEGKILNIHPSLLPRYGGKGMFGIRVHQAVLAAGETKTGVTVHLVNHEYDQGRILAQQTVAIKPGDSPESLAARVLKLEHKIYPETLQAITTGVLRL